ncbi:MAG: AhpC/TSA family protein [Burkholderiaceae bacterium]|nr:AhpC/TSA family protein [Burkholderiaceae bacterium]
MSLQAELDAFMADVRTKVPAEVLAPIEQFYQQDLHRPEHFPRALKIGQKANDFTLFDATGKSVSLTTLRQNGPVIISFYRGAWCPFCNIELRALQKELPVFKELGVNLIAISPEQPDHAMPLIEREKLTFPVLSDPGNKVAKQFGIVFALEGEVRRISHDVFGVDLPKLNGDQSWEIPVPATYLIDADGIVRFAFFDPEFRHRVEPEQLLNAIRKL